jgi:hypothetical protein
MAAVNCKDTECPLARSCRRALDPPEPGQQYFPVSPKWDKGKAGVECNEFLAAETADDRMEEARQMRAEEFKEFLRN